MQFSKVNLSELTEEFRIDAEYYTPENLKKEEVVLIHQHVRLGELCDFIAGPFGSTVSTVQYAPESGKRYIRGKDIQSLFIEESDAVYIKSELFNELTQFHLKEDDLLITVVGMKFGKVAIVRSEDIPAIFSCKSTLLRNPKINSWYLLVYLSCQIGYGLLRRCQRGAAQPGINLFDIKNVPVPILSKRFQKEIEIVIKKSQAISKQSSEIFSQSQITLLSELNLTQWHIKHQLTFIKNYSDTQHSERIDAEYYQPKYEEIITAIKNYSDGWDVLSSLVTINMVNYTPKTKQQYQYIELANIAKNGEISGCMTEDGLDLPSRARRRVATGDLIVSSIEGSLSSIALIEEEYDQALCSTGFYVINSEKLNSETLLVFLKSIAGQMQLKKGCNGTILTAINKGEFSNIILPIIADEKQTQIQQKVTESFALRKQSKQLLESAKKAVEMAIEQDEQSAMDWLELQIKDCQLDN